MVLQRPMISLEVGREVASGDLLMDPSNVGDSSTGRSDQTTMLGNTRKLASSLVEMKISSGDISMKEVAASQGRNA